MEAFLGSSILTFMVLTVVIAGGASILMGQAVANTWRPAWQLLPYSLLLQLFERFLAWSLLDADWESLGGQVASFAVILGFSFLSYRVTLTSKMVNQYPWIYERASPVAWRERH